MFTVLFYIGLIKAGLILRVLSKGFVQLFEDEIQVLFRHIYVTKLLAKVDNWIQLLNKLQRLLWYKL